jgi:hypothetical protein
MVFGTTLRGFEEINIAMVTSMLDYLFEHVLPNIKGRLCVEGKVVGWLF